MISRLIKSSVDSAAYWFPLSIKYRKNASEFFQLENDLSADLKLGKKNLINNKKRDNRKYQFVSKKLVNYLLLVFSRKIWLIESFYFIGDCPFTFRLFSFIICFRKFVPY